jgi:type II secretory pathway pseudopilin PulG
MPTPEPDPRAGERGISLIEIVVSMVLMVFALFGLIQSMVTSNLLERATTERKIAYAFCNQQLETVRSLTHVQLLGLPTATPPGYLIGGTLGTTAGSTVTSTRGFKRSLDNDGDQDRFGLFYSSDPLAVNYNSLLRGLAPQTGFARVAEITFADPDGFTGVGEKEGYWVTVRVFWRGVQGDSSVNMSTFITKR